MLKNKNVKKFITVAFLLLLSFSFKACGGGGGNSGTTVAANNGSGDRTGYLGPEKSALSGTQETVGVFNISSDENSGAIYITPLSNGPLVGLSGSYTSNEAGMTHSITITNTSALDMTGVTLRVGQMDAAISLSNTDGDNFYTFGDIPAGSSLTRNDIKFNGAYGGFTFKAYITQYKPPATTGVIDAGGGSGIASSVFTSLKAMIGGGVSKATATAGTVTQGTQTSVKIDPSGNPKISYMQATSYDLKYASWDGSAWSAVVVDSYGDTGYYSSLALSSGGNPRISYYYANDASGSRTGDLKYAYCNTGAACLTTPTDWTVVTIDSTGDVGGYTSIALDSSGNPRIAYYDFTNMDLKYAFCDANCQTASNWTKVTVDSTGAVGEWASLALDATTNVPRISYYDRTPPTGQGSLKYASCDSSCGAAANWTKTEVANTSGTTDPGGTGLYSSLALEAGSSASPRIAGYGEYTGTPNIWYQGASTSSVYPNLGPRHWTKNSTATSGNASYGMYVLPITGGYRLYYALNTYCCSPNSGELVYQDTTDANLPGDGAVGSNLGTRKFLNVGRSDVSGGTKNDYVYSADMVSIGSGNYRMYYNKYSTVSSVSAQRIYYRDSSGGNPPGCTGTTAQCAATADTGAATYSNLGAETLLINSTDSTSPICDEAKTGPKIIQLPTGYWRIYYAYRGADSPCYHKIAYRDTTTTAPPSNTNLGAQQIIPNFDSANEGQNPEVVQLSSGKYRLYYSMSGTQTKYMDTTDSNPPNTGNMSGTITTLATGYIAHPFMIARPGGGYRYYFQLGIPLPGQTTAYASDYYKDTIRADEIARTDIGATTCASCSGGYYTAYGSSTTSATTTFTGTAVSVIATRQNTDCTGVNVYVDGTLQTTQANFYSGTTYYQQEVWSTSGLSYGTHTIYLSSGASCSYNLDAIDAYNEGISRTEDTAIFTGSTANASCSGGYCKEFGSSSTSTTFSFSGKDVSIIAKKGAGYCTGVNVYIDGALQATQANFYDGSTVYQQVIWSALGLSSGSHSIYLTSGASCTFNIDAFDVDNESTRDTEYPYSTSTSSGTSTSWTRIRVEQRPDSAGLGYDTSTGLFTSLAISTSGKYIMSYYYYGDLNQTYGSMNSLAGDLKYAYCSNATDCAGKPGDDNDGINWNAEDWTNMTLDSANDTGWFTSSVFTTAGRVYTTYYDSGTGDLKIYTCSSYNTCP